MVRFVVQRLAISLLVALTVSIIGFSLLRLSGDLAADLAGEDATPQEIAEVAPMAAAQTKRLVGRLEVPDALESHLRDELIEAARALKSDDGREARRALRERRKPVFAGRREET